MGGQPLAAAARQGHTWEHFRKLVPGILNQGLMGLPVRRVPDIRRWRYLSFENLSAVDQELVVRAAELHALMPMMQFSVAPWRVLALETLAIARRMAPLHSRTAPRSRARAQSARPANPRP